MRPIHYIALSNSLAIPPPEKKKFAYFVTGDINRQISHCNKLQWKKMKIVYNSVYLQKETFNFTFARQAIVVYF